MDISVSFFLLKVINTFVLLYRDVTGGKMM